MSGWIGVDLDGTLAEYGGWKGPGHIGAPIPAMVARLKAWLAEGKDVRIVTARVSSANPADMVNEAQHVIAAWTYEHLGQALPATAEKDYGMVELWDDRAVQVIPNTGAIAVDQAARAADTKCPCCEAGCVGPCSLCGDVGAVTRVASFLWLTGHVEAAHHVERNIEW